MQLSKSYLNTILRRRLGSLRWSFYPFEDAGGVQAVKSGQMYVYEAAAALGYEDQYYFSRIFKKVVGVSPRDYQNGDYFYPE